MVNSSASLSLAAAVAVTSLTFAMNPVVALARTLFDFSATHAIPGWRVVNDDVMGGVSRSAFSVTNGLAVFRGELSLENNGGFASVRTSPARLTLEGCAAVVLRVRGDGRRYKFTLRSEPGLDTPLYQHAFRTRAGAWEEHQLELKDFEPTFRGRVLKNVGPLNSAGVTSVGFLISDKQEGSFRLEIAWIKAVSRPPQ